MARICCLAAIDSKDVPLLSFALKGAGEPALTIVAHLVVPELGKLSPDVLVADIDRVQVDALEMLRQLRFVLPNCAIVVYTSLMESSWGRACHLAGANGVLSKDSDASQLADGLRRTIRVGCFTDPRFAA
jgi:DNA-binding NarL/FixJ family response regulator